MATLGRRKLIVAIGTAAIAIPLVARAQQPAMQVVAVISNDAPTENESHSLSELPRGLAESGYRDGRNVAVEHYLADTQRMPSIVATLVSRNVSVIVAIGNVAALSAK